MPGHVFFVVVRTGDQFVGVKFAEHQLLVATIPVHFFTFERRHTCFQVVFAWNNHSVIGPEHVCSLREVSGRLLATRACADSCDLC